MRPGRCAPGCSPRSITWSAVCWMPSRWARVAGSSRPALAMAWVSSKAMSSWSRVWEDPIEKVPSWSGHMAAVAGAILPGQRAFLIIRTSIIPLLDRWTQAKLLVAWGEWSDRATVDAILGAMALGHIDSYALKPWRSPDERFHRTITECLNEWAWGHPSAIKELCMVGERHSARAHELRDLLQRNGIPHSFYTPDSSEGRELLVKVGAAPERLPLLVLLDGRVLADPSNAELADAYAGAPARLSQRTFDLIVIGAGPAGLAAAVYGASEGLSTLVLE